MRLLTWNLRYDNPADQPQHWAARQPLVAQILSDYDPQLLAFQEVLAHQLQDLIAMLAHCDYCGRGRDADGGGEGLYVFWQRNSLRLKQQQTFWLGPDPQQPGPAWDAVCPRICNQLELEGLSGPSFTIFNVHLDHWGKAARAASCLLLANRIQSTEPFLFLGDLNQRDALASLPGLLGLAQAGRIYDCQAHHGCDRAGTFHGFRGIAEDGPIDYILASPHFSLDFCQRITDHQPGLYPSDHFGLMAQVTLEAGAKT